MTASAPSMAAAGGRSAAAFHACQPTVGFELRARSGSRERPTTSSPRASNESATADPRNPVAPVTRTRTVSRPRSFERPEGPGLLRDASDPVAPRLLDHRLGDGRGDIAVEDARDYVVLAQVVGRHGAGDALRGGELHLLGDPWGSGVERAAEDARKGQDVVDLVRVVGAPGGHDPHVGAG